MDTSDQIMVDRNNEYGNAWLLTGLVMDFVRNNTNNPAQLDDLWRSGYGYVWTIILCKLMRAVTSPTNIDHWADIEVYAKLVRKHIEDPEYMGG